jgi:hypothetical protein
MNSKRMNRLEELGRVDSEKAYTKKGKINLKDEKKRIVNELKDGGEAKQTWITKKSDKTITKQSVNKPKKIEGVSQWITKKSKPYITKKSPDKIQDRERVRKAMGGSMMQRPMYKKGGEAKTMYKPYNQKDLLESAKKARERNKKQDARKKEINEAAKKFKVGGGGKYKYGPHKVDVNRRATEGLFGRGKIQEKIIKFADKFDKKLEDRRKNKKAMGGRIRKMGGGSLKAIPSENKGLKKLPTQVRNKMGYMKNGGRAKMRSGGLAKRGRGCEIR